jgi:hypothetical protein
MSKTREELKDFITSYADDIIHLEEAREALLLHPTVNINRSYMEASLTRLVCVASVGVIELLTEYCKSLPELESITTKLVEVGQKADDENVEALRQALSNRSVQTESQVFMDYWAMKELRNGIVHSNWLKDRGKDKGRDRRELLAKTIFGVFSEVKQEFTVDLMRLTFKHWERIRKVTTAIQTYLLEALLEHQITKRPKQITTRKFIKMIEIYRERKRQAKNDIESLIDQDDDVSDEIDGFLDVPNIRGLYTRNIERFIQGFIGLLPDPFGKEGFIWQHVTASEFQVIEQSLVATQISSANALQVAQLLTVARNPNYAVLSFAKLKRGLEIAQESWEEYAQFHILPLLQYLEPFSKIENLEDSLSSELFRSQKTQEIAAKLLQRLPDQANAALMTEIYAPLTGKILGLQTKPMEPLLWYAHQLAAVAEYKRENKTRIWDCLKWIENVKPRLFQESQEGRLN